MNPKLTPEQTAALNQHPDQPLRIEDTTANRVYFLMDESLATRAMEALDEQNALNNLRVSVAQADAGQTVSLEEARNELRRRLGF